MQNIAVKERPGLCKLIDASTLHLRAAMAGHPFVSALTEGELPKEAYAEFLCQSYLVYHVLENHLRALRARRADVRTIVEDCRFMECNLRHDIAFFRRTPCGVRPLPATRRFTMAIDQMGRQRPLGVLGVHYAMECCREEAEDAADRLVERFQFPTGKGVAYLHPQNGRRAALWHRFCQCLDDNGWSDEEVCDILEGVRTGYEGRLAIATDIVSRLGEEDDED